MRTLLARLLSRDGAPIGLALVAAILILGALNPAFLRTENLSAIAVQSVFILIISLGMTFVLTAGAIDLSVGAVMGLSAGVTIFTLQSGGGTALSCLAGLATGGAFGVLNGILVTRLRLSDFIVTLATMGVASGALQILCYYTPLKADSAPTFAWLAGGKVWDIPFPLIVALVLVTALGVILSRSAFGRRVQASGMSPAAAAFAGIDVGRTRRTVFILSGLFSALAGILLASRLSSVQPALGRGYELQAIAAAVLGGTSLAGGKGSVLGASLAAMLLAALSAGLQIVGVDPTWYQVVVGLSILIAVAFHGWSAGFVERRLHAAQPQVAPVIQVASE